MSISVNEIRHMFARISRTYDRLNTVLSLGLDLRWRNSLLRSIIPKAGKALDCCAGTGELSVLLAKNGYSVTGIDICTEMLDIARHKKNSYWNLTFVVGDTSNLPFQENTFNVLTNAFSLRNLPDKNKVFEEAYRVLAKGGQALFLDLTLPHFWLKPFHKLYLHHILPTVGGLLSGEKGAYQYLAKSILSFPEPLEIKRLLESSGFDKVKITPLSLGIATLWSATK